MTETAIAIKVMRSSWNHFLLETGLVRTPEREARETTRIAITEPIQADKEGRELNLNMFYCLLNN